jgi:hypothetical protein
MLTNAEASALLNEEKIITANIHWRSVGGKHSENYALEATVLAPSRNVTLRLVGHKGKRNRSFALLYGGDPIKMITAHHLHRNPDGKKIKKPHKHVWDEKYEDRKAYIPDDISFGDINREFQDFLKQCNIKLLGTYASIMP